MREVDVGTGLDAPHSWVIEVEMTVEQARRLGAILGKEGFTGKFIDGDIAELAQDGAKWRRLQRGGDVNGKAEDD